MYSNKHRTGFSMFAVLVIVSILGIIGTVAFVVLTRQSIYGLNPKNIPLAAYTPAPTATIVAQPTTNPTNALDLETELNGVTVNSTDTEFTQLNASASSL